MSMEKAAGLVIKSVNYGENDKIITLFTKESGKITAIAKGARNPKSAYVGVTQLFSYCNFVYYTGRSFAYLNQAELIESFHKLRNDLDKLSKGAYMAEALNQAYEEYESDESALRLILNLLYFMNEGLVQSDEVILLAFQIKLLGYLGFAPNLKKCQICSKCDSGWWFSWDLGGLVCKDCSKNNRQNSKIADQDAEFLRYLQDTPISGLKKTGLYPKELMHLAVILNKTLECHTGKRNRSFEFLLNNN